MRTLLPLLFALLAACWGQDAYIVEGTVLEKPSPTRVVVDHEPIPGLMDAMVMPFDVHDAALLADVDPGDRIYARLIVDDDEGTHLEKVRVKGSGPVPDEPTGPAPVQPGAAFPTHQIPVHTGDTWALGLGQGRPTALTFVYTRCPLPEFCPAIISRLQGLQGALEGRDGPRILVVTLDPEHDTRQVLAAFAEQSGADPDRWRFGRVDQDTLSDLAMLSGLPVYEQDGEILHGIRLLILDAEGRLVERYDDNDWPLDRVVRQLRTGGPPAPEGSSGTVTPE